MGNSITERWNEAFPDFFTDNNYINKGISSQTTPQFLARFNKDVIRQKPAIVVINGGINNIAENLEPYSIDNTIADIKRMAEKARAADIEVVLTSVLPAERIYWNGSIKNVPAKIITLNDSIRSYAHGNNIVYVDYYSQMLDTVTMGMIKEYTTDGVHVSKAGYVVMEKIIKETLDNLLKK
ncbi:MAG: GDSL-type esterase/lipase family protein [Dysgonomonas sp.]